jgi:hypothetical protein
VRGIDDFIEGYLAYETRAERILAAAGCEGLYAYARGDYTTAWRHLVSSVPRMAEAGGSHAQRDLFEQISLDTAVKDGRLTAAQQMRRKRFQCPETRRKIYSRPSMSGVTISSN